MVIQRWQSVLLLVATAVMACFTFCSLGQIQAPDYTFNFTTMGFFSEGIATDGASNVGIHTWYLFALSLTTSILLLIDIFLFKNFPLQMKVCLICIAFIIATGAAAYGVGVNGVEGCSVRWSTPALCPAIAVVAAVLAYWRMRKDQEKLRSYDRIR